VSRIFRTSFLELVEEFSCWRSLKVGVNLHNAASSFGSIVNEFEPLFFFLIFFFFQSCENELAAARKSAGTTQNLDFETKIDSNLVLSAFSSRRKTISKRTDYCECQKLGYCSWAFVKTSFGAVKSAGDRILWFFSYQIKIIISKI